MGTKEPKRFEVVRDDKHGVADHIRIIRDTQTGVCYVQTAWGYAGGLTPLLGTDGRPVVRP